MHPNNTISVASIATRGRLRYRHGCWLRCNIGYLFWKTLEGGNFVSVYFNNVNLSTVILGSPRTTNQYFAPQ